MAQSKRKGRPSSSVEQTKIFENPSGEAGRPSPSVKQTKIFENPSDERFNILIKQAEDIANCLKSLNEM